MRLKTLPPPESREFKYIKISDDHPPHYFNMEPDFTIEVSGEKTLIIFSILRAAAAIPILIFSLLLYLIGVLLTLTIIGALAGIPLIVATYGIDMIALAVLISMREKLHIAACPKCARKRLVMQSMKNRFVCKGCKSYIEVVTAG